MIGQIGSFEDVVEKGQSTVRNAAKSTKQGTQNFAKTAAGQITGGQSQTPQNDQGTNETSSTAAQQQMSNDDAQKFLQGLYGKSNQTQSPNAQNSQKPPPPTPQETIKTALGIPQSSADENSPQTASVTVKNALGIPETNNQKTPEELAKIEALRQQLHGQYYQELVNPQKPPEENVTQKIEREDQEEKLADLEETKKKPPPLVNPSMKQGTAESVVGVSG